MATTGYVATIPQPSAVLPQQRPANHIPWRAGLRAGSGINSVTGAIAPTAFEPFDTQRISTEQLTVLIHPALHLHDVYKVSSDVRDSSLLSLQPLSLRAWIMAKAVGLSNPQAHSLSFIVWWTETGATVVPSQQLSLSKPAAELYEESKDHRRFRERHGDYFVAGWVLGKQFGAVVTLTYDEREEACRAVANALQMHGETSGSPRALDVGAIDAALNTHGRPDATSIRIFARNSVGKGEEVTRVDLPDGPSVPANVFASCYAHLREFAAQSTCTTIGAEIQHYSSHFKVPESELAAPVDKITVDDMTKLQSLIEQCAVAAAALPDRIITDPTITALYDEQRFAVGECLVVRPVLPYQPAMRAEWTERLKGVFARFTRFYAIFDAWKKLDKIRAESGSWWDTHYTDSELRWSYGMTESPTSHLAVKALSWEELQVTPMSLTWGWGWAWQSSARDIPAESRIVGWVVESLNATGSWFSPGRLLLRQEARFYFRASRYGKTSKWRITVYFAADTYLDILVRAYPPQ